MSQPDPDTARLIDDEAEHAETTRDDAYPPGVIAQRRNRARSSVYSLRLSDDEIAEIAEIHRLARSADVPASTLVRSWITQHITNTRPTTTIDPALRDAIRTEVEAAVNAALTDTHW
jgi:hypothetical protein